MCKYIKYPYICDTFVCVYIYIDIYSFMYLFNINIFLPINIINMSIHMVIHGPSNATSALPPPLFFAASQKSVQVTMALPSAACSSSGPRTGTPRASNSGRWSITGSCCRYLGIPGAPSYEQRYVAWGSSPIGFGERKILRKMVVFCHH